MVSNYHYQRFQLETFDGSLHEFIHYPYRDEKPADHSSRFGIAPIVNYMNAWVENQEALAQLWVLRYEELKADTRANVIKLLDFVGLEVEDELLDDAIAYGAFDSMRKLEVERAIDWYGLPGASDPRGLKTRRGIVGGYREAMSDEDLAYVNHVIGTELSPYFQCYHPRGE